MAQAGSEQPVIQKGLFYLEDLTLTNFDGSKQQDLQGFVSQLEFEEGLFLNSITGSFILMDGIGLFHKFPMVGEESLTISFKTANTSNYAQYKKTFSVYKIEDVAQSSKSRAAGVLYKCYFASPELLMSESANITRAYTNVYVSDIAQDIFTNYLQTPTSQPFNVETTSQQQQIIIPAMTGFAALNLLTTYATSLTDNYHNLFMCYENRDGLNFNNLLSLYNQDIVYEFRVIADAAFNVISSTSDSNPGDPLGSPLTFNFRQPSDKLTGIRGGTFTNIVAGIDLVSKQVSSTTYNYQSDFNTYQHVDPRAFPLISTAFDYTSNAKKVVYTENYRTKSNYYSANVPSGQTFSKSYEIFLPYRLSLLQLMSNMELEIEVSGNTNITCGNLIRIDYPDPTGSSQGDTVDYYTGNYLVKKIHHHFLDNRYYMKITAMRDCLSKQIGVNDV